MKYTRIGAEPLGKEHIIKITAVFEEGGQSAVIDPNNKKIAVPVRISKDVKHGIVLHPQFRAAIPTGIKIKDAKDHTLQLFPSKYVLEDIGLSLAGGTQLIIFEDDEEKEIYVHLVNTSMNSIWICHGDEIAYGIAEKHRKTTILEQSEGA